MAINIVSAVRKTNLRDVIGQFRVFGIMRILKIKECAAQKANFEATDAGVYPSPIRKTAKVSI